MHAAAACKRAPYLATGRAPRVPPPLLLRHLQLQVHHAREHVGIAGAPLQRGLKGLQRLWGNGGAAMFWWSGGQGHRAPLQRVPKGLQA